MVFWLACGLSTTLLGIALYNRLMESRRSVREAWAVLDVHLARRHSLIADLVEIHRGLGEPHGELTEGLLEAHSSARAAAGAERISERVPAENQLTQAVTSLLAAAQSHHDLKTSHDFSQRLDELDAMQSPIIYGCKNYNHSVRRYNTICETLPGRLMAGLLRFRKMDPFPMKSTTADG